MVCGLSKMVCTFENVSMKYCYNVIKRVYITQCRFTFYNIIDQRCWSGWSGNLSGGLQHLFLEPIQSVYCFSYLTLSLNFSLFLLSTSLNSIAHFSWSDVTMSICLCLCRPLGDSSINFTRSRKHYLFVFIIRIASSDMFHLSQTFISCKQYCIGI